jgi:enoyl-[acyl-carrier protein] reductase II
MTRATRTTPALESPPALHTALCDLLHIDYPVIQAGMGLIARGELAAAVSAAGGLGVIGSAQLTPAELRQEIRRARELTDRPFGVDILFGTVQAAGDEVARYSDEVAEQVEITLAERVPVLISGLGNPILAIDRAHDIGTVVMSVVGNSRQARKLEDAAVDAIIGQGSEGGGHTGRVGAMVLIPQLVDTVHVPVVAAGGLADGRGLVAALALGASGVWMGTRFIATAESFAHENYKQKIVSIDEEGTVVSRAHSGKPCRLIKNEFTAAWEQRADEIEPFPLQFLHVGVAASGLARLAGDVEHGSAPAGQSAALIHSVTSAGQVVEDVVNEAREALARLGVHGALT